MRQRAGANAMMAAAMMMGAMGGMPGMSRGPVEKPQRQCLQCGKPHRHNNSWCSAECCREWRRLNKGSRQLQQATCAAVNVEAPLPAGAQ